jgi:single-stranded-DNA-specific exonuclease
MKPVTERSWRLKECDKAIVDELVQKAGIPALLARLLALRGITSSEVAQQFLSPTLAGLSDPFLLKGMQAAAERVVAARKNREKVCIHGDYDVDGVTSVALLESFFKAVGIDVCHVIPLRLEDGYGLSNDGVDEAVRRGARLLITVDCGITSLKEAIYCQSRGVDLIVTDHHTPGHELPAAVAVVNPLQTGCEAPFKQFAGVGLAFKLVMAIRSILRTEGHFAGAVEPNLREYLDLVALGTIADLVPLVGENRIIAAFGLKELTSSRRVGVIALKKVAAVDGAVTSGAVGFRLAPRLNAAGRLDDAERGVELLLSADPEAAAGLAGELDAGNRERQEIEKEMLDDALAMVAADDSLQGKFALVMASRKWHPGVIGIVASRLVDLYHRPTILIAVSDGIGKGSGRSIPAFHLFEGVAAASRFLVKFGGHRQAAGLMLNEADIATFAQEFNAVAAQKLTKEDLVPTLNIDAELRPEDISTELVSLQEQLRPFGMGNPEPVFMLGRVTVVEARTLKDLHLKLRLKSGSNEFAAIGFNMAGAAAVGDLVDVAFNADLNIWNGREELQLRLKGIRRTGSN